MQLRHSPLQHGLDETVEGQSREQAEYIRCRLTSSDGRLRALQSDDEPLGVLSTRLYSLIRRIHASGCVFTELVITLAAYKMATVNWKRIGTSARCPVELNVYSHRHAAGDTGKMYVNLSTCYSCQGHIGVWLSYRPRSLNSLSSNFMSLFPHRKSFE